jgi:hypothetical protein
MAAVFPPSRGFDFHTAARILDDCVNYIQRTLNNYSDDISGVNPRGGVGGRDPPDFEVGGRGGCGFRSFTQ